SNPCHLVEKMIPEHTVTNMACLPFEQMPKFWATINQTEITNEVRIALALYNYLAVRPNELANAKWDEIDLEKGIWLIPAHRMKMRK
ncbi:tyrosine-type recombinase/integrase, partial [Mannheimia haemolytica]|uniref:tyrosine-type recombinase/integrase n=1 Tax=Mannheimia haemolytica TaxID=75985 RepID=UPI00115C7484